MVAPIETHKVRLHDWAAKNSALFVILIINAIVIFVAYSLFLRTHFSADSYATIVMSNKAFMEVHAGQGRWLNALIVFAIYKLGISIVFEQQLGFLALAASLIFCATFLVNCIKSSLKQVTLKHLLIIDTIVLVSFVNVFSAEIFYYPESTLLGAVGLLLEILAVGILTKKWSISRMAVSCFLIILACSMYQIFFESFVIYSLCILLIQNDFRFSKSALLNTIKVLSVALIGIIVCLGLSSLTITFFSLTPKIRTTLSLNPEIIIGNLKKILQYHIELYKNASGLLPGKGVLIWLICIVCVLGALPLVDTLRPGSKNRRKAIDFAYIAAILIGCYIVIFAPHIVSPVFWPAPRTMSPLFSWLSLLAIIVVSLGDKQFVQSIVAAVCTIFLCINIIMIQQMAADQLIVNAMDRQYAMEVLRKIESYELTTGNTVTRISIKQDISPTYGYYDVTKTTTYDMGVRASVVSWSIGGLMYYVTGRSFIIDNMDDGVYLAHFDNKDWNTFIPEEQMFFSNDTLNLMLY